MERKVEVEGKVFVFEQRGMEVRRIIYDYEKCVGCGICVYACPVKAVELQQVHDIALGLDMPPVMIDHTKCVFCGICFAFCPVNALKFVIDDFEVPKSMTPAYLKGSVEKIENCVNCAICYRICPTKAIERRIKLRREDIPIRNEIRGSIRINDEKCRLCGICVEFCSAFKVIEGDGLRPFERILVDESKCDYCKLCEDVCPNDAIEVEGKRIAEDLPEVAEVVIDEEKCIFCGRCVKACPYDGVRVEKPMEGKVIVYEGLLKSKCDPIGCKACVLICPARAWKIEEGKVAVDEEICIFCGACENACHMNLIVVERRRINVETNETPWTKGWLKAVDRILNETPAESEEPPEFEVKEEEQKIIEAGRKPEIDEELLRKLVKVEEKLKSPRFRRRVELKC